MKTLMFILFFGLMFSSSSNAANEYAWMEKGKNSVKMKLKDPGSAIFRGLYFHEGADGLPVTCGEVNSKNSYGGYIGYQKFISAGKAEYTYLEEEISDFHNAWNRFCM